MKPTSHCAARRAGISSGADQPQAPGQAAGGAHLAEGVRGVALLLEQRRHQLELVGAVVAVVAHVVCRQHGAHSAGAQRWLQPCSPTNEAASQRNKGRAAAEHGGASAQKPAPQG